jgi:hypothetical protein
VTRGRWTPAGAIARSRKNCTGAAERLRAVALEWGDVDQGIVEEAEDLLREVEAFGRHISEWINERLAAGEHVGL